MKRLLSTLLLAVLCCTVFMPSAQAASFSDLQNHWSFQDVKKLVDRGAVGGYPDGTFRPDATITRAEFSKILRQSLNLPAATGSDCADTASHWAGTDIHTLVANNIIVPAEYGRTYGPDTAISRREIAIMLVRAMGLNDDAVSLAGQPTAFTDDAAIADYDKGYLYLAKELGLVGGYEDGRFLPNNNSTRAEACVMLVRLLNLKGLDTDVPQNNSDTTTTTTPTTDQNACQLTLQSTERSARNALGEQYLYANLQLTVHNQNGQAVTVTQNDLKIRVTYESGAQVVAMQPDFSQTIAAQQSKTLNTTVSILLPDNQVATMVLGNKIAKIQTEFTYAGQTYTFEETDTALLHAVQ